ncbi:hypothetical protein BWQ96_10022 [Gracilariopsis chorda]|uniref:Uncharacterized protein n=1 Tax=Gracilariopsis chorda TaxID=448386 RepID=A0A2V3IGJ7_9FLOR|nr:hypothetical protein BWQ96_10022 [Gracilariopsis chorda]|eukprot:PXF40270.1 hypothetical protein BWQ96_10022 [Gracilariopsis chorda]
MSRDGSAFTADEYFGRQASRFYQLGSIETRLHNRANILAELLSSELWPLTPLPYEALRIKG